MSSLPLLAFLPEEFIPLLPVVAGLLLIFGLRSAALGILQLVGLLIVLPLFLGPLLDMLPLWVLLLMMLFLVFSMFKLIVGLVLGREAAGQFIGTLAADLFKWVLFIPGKAIKFLVTRILRRPSF